MATLKLTKRAIDAFHPVTRGYLWDSQVPGFGVRCSPSGRRTFVLSYRADDGTKRMMTLGTSGELTVEQARHLAMKALARVREGEDPSHDRQERRAAPTFGEVAEEWFTIAQGYKKASSLANDRLYLEKYILPALGSKKVASVSLAHVEGLHRRVGEKFPVMANRILAVVSSVLTHAERQGHRQQGTNVCRLVHRYPEKERHRALSEVELHRLAAVLLDWPDQGVADCLRLILLTGMRRSEAAHLRWSEVDADHLLIRLEDSKSGPRVVYLSTAGLEILERQERKQLNPFVFPSRTKQGAPLSDLKRAWRRIRAQAGLGTLRVHDLRHHAGEALATMGFNEAFISKILGHKDHSVTRRYIDVAASPLHQAAERYGQTLAAALGIEGSLRKDSKLAR